MGFFVTLLINVGLYVVGRLLSPKPPDGHIQPGGIGDVSGPQVQDGAPVAICWGRVLIRSANLLWYGHLLPQIIRKDGRETGRFRYHIGLHYGICSGVMDDIDEIRFDGKKVRDTFDDSDPDFRRFILNDPNLFGGDDNEGGIQGTIDVYYGSDTQAPSSYLTQQLGDGGGVPAYRGLCHAVARQLYVGTSLYLKEFAVVGRRMPNGLGLAGGKHVIDADANPACMIYDLLTAPRWRNGLGIDPARIDVAGLQAIGNTLFDEGLGLSMVVDTRSTGTQVLEEILRHIDGIMFTHPETGLLTFRLARDDYDVGDLPVLDPSNCIVRHFARPSWSEVKSSIIVEYTSRADGYTLRTTPPIYDLAAVANRGGQVQPEVVQFRGASTAAVATKLGARSLRSVSYPLAALSIESTRVSWDLLPGSVAVLNWPPLGISGFVIRVTSLNDEALVDGRMTLECVQDIFGVGQGTITAPPGSGWEDPWQPISDLGASEVVEAPYDVAFGLVTNPDAEPAVVVHAVAGDVNTLGVNAYVRKADNSGWHAPVVGTNFPAAGRLTDRLAPGATSLTIRNLHGFDLVAPSGSGWLSTVYVDREYIAFTGITDHGNGTYTLTGLIRGQLDTVPISHAAESLVWLGYTLLVRPALPTWPATVLLNRFRFQPFGQRGEYEFGDLADVTLPIATPYRAQRPLAPTDVRLNGALFPAAIIGELTVSWAHRNRLAFWKDPFTAGRVETPESGTTYTVTVYGEDDTVIHEEFDIAGTTWTYAQALEEAESGTGLLSTRLRVQVHAVRDGIESWMRWEHVVTR